MPIETADYAAILGYLRGSRDLRSPSGVGAREKARSSEEGGKEQLRKENS